MTPVAVLVVEESEVVAEDEGAMLGLDAAALGTAAGTAAGTAVGSPSRGPSPTPSPLPSLATILPSFASSSLLALFRAAL